MSRVIVVGSVNLDRVVEVTRLPRPGESVSAIVARTDAGGKGGNQAHYAARAAREAPVTLIARVGNDNDGTTLTQASAAAGVDVSGIIPVGGETGQALILVDAHGENQIAVVPGANHRWGGAPLHLNAQPGDVVVLQGEIPAEVNERAAREAHAAGARVVLNPAPYAPGLIEFLGDGDVLVLNETEAADAFGCTPSEVPARLRGTGYDVVVTLGADGVLLSASPHRECERLAAYPTTVVDTVGAGDAFVGGLASALAEGAGLPLAVRRGAAVAALAVTTAGARSDVVTRARVDAVLEEVASC